MFKSKTGALLEHHLENEHLLIKGVKLVAHKGTILSIANVRKGYEKANGKMVKKTNFNARFVWRNDVNPILKIIVLYEITDLEKKDISEFKKIPCTILVFINSNFVGRYHPSHETYISLTTKNDKKSPLKTKEMLTLLFQHLDEK